MKKFYPFGVLLACVSHASAATLINGSFEFPGIADDSFDRVHEEDVVGWETSDSSGNIEVWRELYRNVPAYRGNQFVEINATENAALFQDVNITEFGAVNYGFAHRGREGTDVMRVDIIYAGPNGVIDTPDSNMVNLMTNTIVLGGDDLIIVDGSLSANQYSATENAWEQHSISALFNADSNSVGIYRFSYAAVSSSNNNPGEGNFIDDVYFGVNAVPEPSSVMISALGGLILLRRRR
ncbi:PEP-CTERM sorting domain-containing protein [Haloferula chungangensis]|uniref:PEP-CTERM sorting domain-containing protein n=1 Tax=Haloferula chungangensis TaxID=1048331 RepID=A0ABW2L9V0_9BACT